MSNPPIRFSPLTTTVPGYPRVATSRVYKSLLERFWSQKTSLEAFEEGVRELRTERLRVQREHGLEWIPSGDFSLYDHVLDTALMLGCVPERFGWSGDAIGPELTFALARGKDGVPPLEMTKWFDTNYHYLVPELPDRFRLTANRPLEDARFAREIVGVEHVKPVLLGPFTFLKLARLEGSELATRLDALVPIYEEVLRELAAEGFGLIQMDEPSLVTDLGEGELEAFRRAYERLAPAASLIVQTYYGDVAPSYDTLCALPVAGLGLDFVRGRDRNLACLQGGFPADKLLVAGVVDGRNVWRTDLEAAKALVQEIASFVPPERLAIGSSCSLLHLPETVASEQALPSALRGALAFAQERLEELRLLAGALRGERPEGWDIAQAALAAWREEASRFDERVQARVAAIREEDTRRMAYAQRRPLQDARLKLPMLPTTTIGSFPQTPELRKARRLREADPAAYEAAIREEIERVIRLQEEIGLDVLVHGEPERNDMVQFFGDQMKGFATTEEGWVQSYGSRCVRPPIIFGDVDRLGPMTVKELRYAQSLTERPVKGMLTGPITILQWSFVREDIPRREVAAQIALAIRDEVRDLEEAGLSMVQIDEAAFREGLPLRREDWPEYAAWAVRSFRIATGGARPETQIHTHMCYSEFGDMIESIAAMDADVISIEDARSEGALFETLREFRYPQQIGPGVYDIHSPNVPSVEFVEERLRGALACLPLDQVWVNPDCGLKTRRYEEVVPALRNMVEGARNLRR